MVVVYLLANHCMQLKTLLTIDKCGLKIARNSVFDNHFLPDKYIETEFLIAICLATNDNMLIIQIHPLIVSAYLILCNYH